MNLSSVWSYLERVARERLQNNQTELQVTEYGTDIELIGAAGEVAARRFLKLSSSLHTEFDNGIDFLWGGKSVDVKATRRTPLLEFRFLQWPLSKPIKADLVIMTAVDLEQCEAEVLGYAFRNEILRAPVNHARSYPCREIPVTALHSPWNLFDKEIVEDRYGRFAKTQTHQGP
jgi:hypothetical protein